MEKLIEGPEKDQSDASSMPQASAPKASSPSPSPSTLRKNAKLLELSSLGKGVNPSFTSPDLRKDPKLKHPYIFNALKGVASVRSRTPRVSGGSYLIFPKNNTTYRGDSL